ncbi:MAG: asparaginase [Betaproteobacteria bacterium]|nr:asparaginase [Betaproteobacteria bacterium]
MPLPNVCIVATGGTIASRFDAKLGGPVAAASAEELIAAVPGLHEAARIHAVQHTNINSPRMDSLTVLALRDRLRQLLADDDVAGAVVTHGTATLEETAYLLELTLGGDKPVVVTGAQRNADEHDADGPRNLLYAVRIAGDPAAAGRGVMVAMGGEIHAAREAVKAHSAFVNAFTSRDGGRIGMVAEEGVTWFSRPEQRLRLDVSAVKTNVQLVVMTQGSNDLLLRACVAGDADGIVVDAVGSGNVNLPFYEAICDALAAGIPVVVSSRHLAGRPHASKGYPGSLASLLEGGAISAGYLSGIKARILLMVALAHTRDRDALRAIFARA